MTPPVSFNSGDTSFRATASAGKPAARSSAKRESIATESAYDAIYELYSRLQELSRNNIVMDRYLEVIHIKDRADGLVQSIRKGFPHESAEILDEFIDLYTSIGAAAISATDSIGFDLTLSMFMQANDAVASLLSKNIGAREMIAGVRAAKKVIFGNDEGPAFTSKYRIRLAYYGADMTEEEKDIITRCKQHVPANSYVPPVNPYETDVSFLNNVSTCNIDNELSRYPAKMISKLPKRMAVIPNTHGVVGCVGRDALGKPIMFTRPDPYCLHHEWFHCLKKGDGPLRVEEDMTWELIAGELSYGPTTSTTGFAEDYGKKNDDEDQATVAEMLFTINAKELRIRLSANSQLLSKVELITGCEYDVKTGRFVKLMNKTDLTNRFGLVKPMLFFYAKWSKGKMDANYWNNILAQNGSSY